MKIAVLFDGAGLARLGLEQAGHECIGVELDPWKHYLGQFVGKGVCNLVDVREVMLSHLLGFDAVWASPPCARRSEAIKDLTRRGGMRDPTHQEDLLQWTLDLLADWSLCKRDKDRSAYWVENVTSQSDSKNEWGHLYNAAQFEQVPRQQRNRVIAGRYREPHVFAPYKRAWPGICPCISATEYKGCATDRLRASRFYGRRLTLKECAYHMGFDIPKEWGYLPDAFMPDKHRRIRLIHWERQQYEAIGNGVPVYMAKAFGEAYK